MKKLLLSAATTAMVIASCSPQKNTSYCFDEMTYSPQQTVFKVFAPDSAQCFVVIGGDSLPMSVYSEEDGGCIYKATVQGDQKGKEYVFVVDGQSSPGVFAKAVNVNGQKGVVVHMPDTDPEGWGSDRGPHPQAFADWVIYEMHHRDFSIARTDAQHKGKFLALTEPWALQHLKTLGVNAVHLLPSYDFGSIDETRLEQPQYNWGYDPVNYNVPEGSYSTDAADPLCRIREFKQMVQALHKAGINVILDVVYNHTYDIEHSNFQRTYPDYYYRKAASEGVGGASYSNGSGCGNETASEKPMMRRFMIASVKHWIEEYHIDGFRFDLMGCHDIETMNAIRQAVDQIDSTIFIYGEGWSAGQCALPTEQLGVKANIPQMPRIAAFSDDIRDALRGPFNDDTKAGWLGLASDAGSEADLHILKESLKAGIAGMIAHPQVDYSQVNYSKEPYALQPTQMISYVSCHDDMCLVDRLVASIHGMDNTKVNGQGGSPVVNRQLIALDLLAQTAVFTSQGVPFMLSGEELLRSKKGVHNSFESPDSINQLDWTALQRHPEVFNYYSRLIAMRRHHPAFRMGDADLVRSHLTFLPTADDGTVAFRISDAPADEWRDIIVILNANATAAQVDVPEDSYVVVCRDGQIDEQGLSSVSGPQVTVAPQSALIMHGQ